MCFGVRKTDGMEKKAWPRLRPANNNDCDNIASLVDSILREYDLKLDPACTDADIKDIESSYFGRDHRSLRALSG